MTNQAMFDKVVRHLLKQGEQSRSVGDTGSMCMYRGSNKRQCALGPLIPERKYRPEFEGSTLDSGDYVEELRRAIGLRGPRQVQLAKRLQDIHDNSDVSTWMTCLKNLSREFRLTFPRIARTRIAVNCGGLA